MKRLITFLKTNVPIENRTKIASTLIRVSTQYQNGRGTDIDAAIVLVNLSKLLDVSVKQRNYQTHLLDALPIDKSALLSKSVSISNSYVRQLMDIERAVYTWILARHPKLFDNPEVKSYIGKYLLRPLTYNKHFLIRLIDIARTGKYIAMSDEDLERSTIDSGKSPIWSFPEDVFAPGKIFKYIHRIEEIDDVDVIISMPAKTKTRQLISLVNEIGEQTINLDPAGIKIAEAEHIIKHPAYSLAFILNSFDSEIVHNIENNADFRIAFISCFPDDTCQIMRYNGYPTVSFAEFEPKMFLASFPELKSSVISYWLAYGNPPDKPEPKAEDEDVVKYFTPADVTYKPEFMELDGKWADPKQIKEFKYDVEILTLKLDDNTLFAYVDNYVAANR